MEPLPYHGPRGLPVVGNLFQVARDPLRFFTDVARIHGDVAMWQIGRQRVHLLSHPDLVEEVLTTKAGSFRKDPITRRLSDVLGNGLLTSEGETWKRARRRVGPAFQREQLSHYADVMVECATRCADRLLQADVVSLHGAMGQLALEIVVRTLFGAAPNPRLAEVGGQIQVMMDGFEHYLRSWQRLLPDSLLGPARRRIQKVGGELNSILLDIIHERQASPARGNDVLSRLLDARDESGGMTDRELRDEAITMFVAGHETTALVLAFALYLLGFHPHERTLLADEVSSVLGTRPAVFADVGRMTRTRAIVEEVMRLYPPAYLIARESTEDVRIGGHPFPAGSFVVLPQWVVHRDPRWYRDPLSFQPGRWLDGSLVANPKYAYFPFGGGPRTCVGNHFAMTEAILVLATLTQRLDWKATEVRDLRLNPAVTLRPAVPLEATFWERP